jgi:CheY-like chemotaxis protein
MEELVRDLGVQIAVLTVPGPASQATADILVRAGVKNEHTVKVLGSGLGLSRSKRFAEGMGGALEVLHSEPGVGTTFRLALPVARAAGDPVLHRPGGAPCWRVELRGLLVLVAEDNQEVRATTAELLRSLGATVVEACDGQEALERAREMSFDAILMDLRMPHLDGLEATRRLRAAGVTAPIVALTAYAAPEQEAECLEAGCSGYLPKPIDLARLVERLGLSASSGKPQR